jgi:AcrR family transcriptional regulator
MGSLTGKRNLAVACAQGQSGSTKLRLVEAAAQVFAAKGYNRATVAEICQQADANIASVNYHFGGKEKLYEAVWGHLLHVSDQAHPTIEAPRGPEDFIRAFIGQRVRSVFDEGKGGWMPRILHRQMANPTAQTERLVEKYLVPRMRTLERHVAELAGLDANSFAVKSCAMSIQSQIILLNVSGHARRQIFGRDRPTAAQEAAIIDHITRFALGGIRAIAEGRQ